MRRLIPLSFLLAFLYPLASKAFPDNTSQLKPVQQSHPLLFIENKGQVTDQDYHQRKDIDFKMQAGGLSIFVGDGQLHYQFSKSKIKRKNSTEGLLPFEKPTSNIDPTIETYRMDVVLAGANKNAKVIAEEQQDYFENYYLPQVGANGATAHSYTQITYKDIYPHIDWVLYSRNNELKYDFVVHPGGNPKDIQLQYNGAILLELKEGALTATTPMGSITEAVPYSYEAATKRMVVSNYYLKGNVLGFEVDDYKGELIIDPSLVWATYFGGSDAEFFSFSDCDTAGNIYMGGQTFSTSNIATTGAFQGSLAGLSDIFLSKYDQAGALKWATYCGGVDVDSSGSIACDIHGNIYINGYSKSSIANDSSLSTPGTQQRYMRNGSSTFLIKFDANGSRLWGTYYGTGTNDNFFVACDEVDNVYLSGNTDADTGFSTPGAHQLTKSSFFLFPDLKDGFIAKFNSSGMRVWGTYFGINVLSENIIKIVCKDGALYAAGSNTSPGLATPGAHQTTSGGSNDAFLSKWDTAGHLLWCTLYGGNGIDYISAITCDSAGDVYIAGSTSAATNIATPGSFQPVYAGNRDGFMAKFTPAGTRLWGTYFGTPDFDYISGIHYNPLGKIYITGSTFPQSLTGNLEGFIAQFRTNGELLWSDTIGGPDEDVVGREESIISSYHDKIIISGNTRSTTGIATPGSNQQIHGGDWDAFLCSFIEELDVNINQPFNDTLLCVTSPMLAVPYNITGVFNYGNVFTMQLSDASGSFVAPIDIGSIASLNAGTIMCTIPQPIADGQHYRLRIKASDPLYYSADNGKDIEIGHPVTPPVGSSNSPVCANREISLQVDNPATGVKYKWAGPAGFNSTNQNAVVSRSTMASAGDYVLTVSNGGCFAKDTVTVVIKPTPVLTSATNNSPVCYEAQLELKVESNTTDASYTWFKEGDVYTGKDISFLKADKTNNGDYNVFATGSNGCVSDTVATSAQVLHFEAKAGSNSIVKPGDTLKLSGTSNFPEAAFSWEGPNSFSSDKQNPVIEDVGVEAEGTYNFKVSYKGCSDATSTYVAVSKLVKFVLYANPNDGDFTIEGNILRAEAVPLVIISEAGQVVYHDEIPAGGKKVKKTISLKGKLSNGVYTIKLIAAKKAYEVKMIVGK